MRYKCLIAGLCYDMFDGEEWRASVLLCQMTHPHALRGDVSSDAPRLHPTQSVTNDRIYAERRYEF